MFAAIIITILAILILLWFAVNLWKLYPFKGLGDIPPREKIGNKLKGD